MIKQNEILSFSITKVSKCIQNGEISPVELVEDLLNHLDQVDPILNSFITVNREEAIKEAIEMENEIKRGNYKGPLHGIPIGVKDNIHTKGMKTTSGSKIYKDYIPEKDAFVIERLKEAGAIIIGKHNTHEVALGTTGDRSYFGAVRNPYNTTRMAGGSSSGSAAAVAACLSYGAIGTDAGGSIRLPASFCGIVGMKPTYGTVSKHGMHPISPVQDHVGPMTRKIHDNALMLNAISGFDSEDPDTIYRKPEDFTRLIGKDIKGTSIGIPNNFFYEDLNEEISKVIKETITIFEALGARITRVTLPNMEKFSVAQRVILSSDAYAVNRVGLERYPDLWDDEVKERLLAGRYIRGFEYADALQTRKLAKKEFNDVFEKVDVILTPTTSILPPLINERFIGNDQNAINIRQIISKQTSPTNLNGFPSLALPCGFSREGLPIGIQFIGREWEEAKLYQFGYALEQELSLETAKIDINHMPQTVEGLKNN